MSKGAAALAVHRSLRFKATSGIATGMGTRAEYLEMIITMIPHNDEPRRNRYKFDSNKIHFDSRLC